ncbi:MAG: hypothetical protein FWE35_18520 [Streptosporangiales bacterium]|nr:hypothetical protein [Streptosporangiales bacterium]
MKSSRGRARRSDGGVGVFPQGLQGGLDAGQVPLEVGARGEAEGGRLAGDGPPFPAGQPEQEGDDAGGVRLGEVRREVAFPAVREAVDEFVREGLEPGREGADDRGGKGLVQEPPEAPVLLVLLADDPAAEPGGALAETWMLEQFAGLGVPEHGQTVLGAGVPAALAGRLDLVAGDGERRVGDG